MFIHSLFALLLLAFAAIIFIPALIIGAVGAHRLRLTREQQLIYASTRCFVASVAEEPLSYDCNCDGCHPNTCYAEHFAVQYSIANGTNMSGMIHIDETPRLLQIQVNNSYACFYDRTDVRNVRWSMPSERPALAMLIVGFTVAEVITLGVVLSQIWWLVKQDSSAPDSHQRF